MSSIAIIAPDGNRVIGLHMDGPLSVLQRAPYGDPRVTREESISVAGDWPFRFDRVLVCGRKRWRSYRPDYLPTKYW